MHAFVLFMPNSYPTIQVLQDKSKDVAAEIET